LDARALIKDVRHIAERNTAALAIAITSLLAADDRENWYVVSAT